MCSVYRSIYSKSEEFWLDKKLLVIEACRNYAKNFRTNPGPLSSFLALQVSLRFTGNKTTYLTGDPTCDNFEYDLPDL